MAFPDSFMDELLRRNEITDVVSSYVTLSRRGGNLFGLCPFHSEKTPSFSVSPDKQIYHCFGCGAGGSTINFVMQIENLDFPDAVRFLARRAGLEVPESDGYQGVSRRREKIVELNRLAAKFYHETLFKISGSTALSYLESRGLKKNIIVKFGLGAAPDSWDGLIKELQGHGYEKTEMLEAGLAVKNTNGNIYDRFRNRVMFPIIDVRGNVIGFGGRVLDDSLPKYLNSSDTAAFNKSRNLFALNLAKNSKRGHIVLTEGYMDAIALYKAGIDCAVASLGTSLTQDHAQLLTRYTKEVVIAYDSDSAGMNAASRAIGILEKTGLNVKVIHMQGAKDPDEFIDKFGRDAMNALIKRSEPHNEYRLRRVRMKYNLDDDAQRVGFIKEATQMLCSMANAVEREVYAARAAEMAGVAAEAVLAEVKRERVRYLREQKKKEERKILAPLREAQPTDRSIKYNNVKSALAEEGILRILCVEPECFGDTGGLSGAEFSSQLLGRVYADLKKRYESGKSVGIYALGDEYTDAELRHLTRIMQKQVSAENRRRELKDYIERIKSESRNTESGGYEDDFLLKMRDEKIKKGMEDKDDEHRG